MHIFLTNSARKFIGEAAHCIALARGLTARGHTVTLVVRAGFELEARAREAGIAVLPLRFSGSFDPMGDWRDLRALARHLRHTRADIVHCHRGKDHWLAALARLAGAPRVPVVRTRHVVVPMRDHAANRWLLTRRTARMMAVSGKAADSLGSMRALLGDRLSVVYSAVDTARFHPGRRSEPWRARLGVAPGQPLVGLVARIQNIKGQRVFVEAAGKVARGMPSARFLAAGRGSADRLDRLRDQGREAGLHDGMFTVAGWIDDVETAIASLDVSVIASLGSEGSSRIAYEAMASGVPLVATTVGCLPEIVEHGANGLLVPPGDADALAAAILRLLREPALARRLADEALRRILADHTPERWISDILAVYERARSRAK